MEDSKEKNEEYYSYFWLRFAKIRGFNIQFQMHFCKDCGHFTIDLFKFSFSLIFYTKIKDIDQEDYSEEISNQIRNN